MTIERAGRRPEGDCCVFVAIDASLKRAHVPKFAYRLAEVEGGVEFEAAVEMLGGEVYRRDDAAKFFKCFDQKKRRIDRAHLADLEKKTGVPVPRPTVTYLDGIIRENPEATYEQVVCFAALYLAAAMAKEAGIAVVLDLSHKSAGHVKFFRLNNRGVSIYDWYDNAFWEVVLGKSIGPEVVDHFYHPCKKLEVARAKFRFFRIDPRSEYLDRGKA